MMTGFPNKRFECRAKSRGLVFRIPLPEIVNLLQTTGNMQALLRTYALGILARVRNAIIIYIFIYIYIYWLLSLSLLLFRLF